MVNINNEGTKASLAALFLHDFPNANVGDNDVGLIIYIYSVINCMYSFHWFPKNQNGLITTTPPLRCHILRFGCVLDV